MPATAHDLTLHAPRVVVVDADRRVQQSLADLLTLTGRVEVVARAGDVRSALEAVEATNPDAVLVDPRLPDVEAGTALISGLSRARPDIRVVMTGWADTEGHADNRLGNLVPRYVSKGEAPEAFVEALVAACCR